MPSPAIKIAATLCMAWGGASAALAAESELVGRLALALEPEVAAKLGLTDEQRTRLQQIADDREAQGMSLAMRVASLPRQERLERLAEFRAESQRLGLAALSPPQRETLEQLAAERDDPALRRIDTRVTRPDEPPAAGGCGV